MFRRITVLIIKFYQLIFSPDHGLFKVAGPACRFYPTCSQYSLEAIKQRGLFKGGILSIKRILRCHPFCEGGWDPVPKK